MNPLLLIAAGVFFLIIRKDAPKTSDAYDAADAARQGVLDAAANTLAYSSGGAVYTGGSGAAGTHGVGVAPNRISST